MTDKDYFFKIHNKTNKLEEEGVFLLSVSVTSLILAIAGFYYVLFVQFYTWILIVSLILIVSGTIFAVFLKKNLRESRELIKKLRDPNIVIKANNKDRKKI